MVRVVRATQVEIETAVQALRDGELVAFPTETVYGLGANAQNPAAVRKIFEAKGRPPTHPVIVHLDSPRFLHRWVREVPQTRRRASPSASGPGPLTMVMPRAANVHDVITGGQDTIAIRVPAHPDGAAAADRLRRRHRRALRQPLRAAVARPAPSTCARSSAMRCA